MEIEDLEQNLPERLSELGANYDPQKLAAMFSHKKGELSARAVAVSGALGGFLSRIAKDWATGQLQSNTEKRAHQLMTTLTRLGPSFVKLGQALSLRPDLLPKPYLEALSELQVRSLQRTHCKNDWPVSAREGVSPCCYTLAPRDACNLSIPPPPSLCVLQYLVMMQCHRHQFPIRRTASSPSTRTSRSLSSSRSSAGRLSRCTRTSRRRPSTRRRWARCTRRRSRRPARRSR
jgi:hypothetical protein